MLNSYFAFDRNDLEKLFKQKDNYSCPCFNVVFLRGHILDNYNLLFKLSFGSDHMRWQYLPFFFPKVYNHSHVLECLSLAFSFIPHSRRTNRKGILTARWSVFLRFLLSCYLKKRSICFLATCFQWCFFHDCLNCS